MIGQFRFQSSPPPDHVGIRLQWCDGERAARVELPFDLAERARADAFPADRQVMSLASALSYAVFLALTYERPIDVCGDRSVWDPRWGPLHSIHLH